jgi:hypothetical protein
MRHVLSSHTEYLNRYGLYRWVLRECVRANPLYVVSAALLSYGVLQLNVEIDPQIGKEGGVLASLALLHLYEISILVVACIVLKNRSGGGRDLHGLMIVAALFMSGSFLALDEQITLTPRLGIVLVALAIALAGIKLTLYARLPGVLLPFNFRICILTMIAGHAISPLLGEASLTFSYGKSALQGLGWLCGWVSLLPLVWLAWSEHQRPSRLKTQAPQDPMETRWCGVWAIVISLGVNLFHLIASDWVFDRPSDIQTAYPALIVVATLVILMFWQRDKKLGFWTTSLFIGQAVLIQWLWSERAAPSAVWNWEMPFRAAVQCCAAFAIACVALARATGNRDFYLGLLSPVIAPLWAWAYRSRSHVPHFRALLSSAMGFACLLIGMALSLYRERLLRWLDPERPVITLPVITEPPVAPNLTISD